MKNSKIEWCDHTFNPVIGCTKISQECKHCYAEALNNRWHGGENWGPGAPRQRTSNDYWRQPLKWNREAAEAYNAWSIHSQLHGGGPHYPEPQRPRVFCASLADWLDHEWKTEIRKELFDLIEATPFLDWLLLTKRPESWSARLHEAMAAGSIFAARWLNGEVPANIWVGTSIGTQFAADERIPKLLEIPSRIRFLSCEPLLENVSLGLLRSPAGGRGYIDWVICGGESGPCAREMRIEWARSLRDQCRAAGVPFFMKQLGGVKNKRGEISDFPAALQIREFPACA